MRHRKTTVKLGRKTANRDALMASLVRNLVRYGRIRTTLPKAKAVRPFAEKMVTLGKTGTLAARRRAIAELHSNDHVRRLFASVAPAFADRKGGYTRIVKLGKRMSDSSEMAILEWTNYTPPEPKAKPEKGGKAAKTPPAEEKKTESAKP